MKRKLFAVATVFIASSYAFGAYVTDGLVLRYDAIDNAGVGSHSDSPTVWKDLSGNNHDLTLPGSGLTVGVDTITFDHVAGTVSGLSCLADSSGTPNLTLEVVCAATDSYVSSTTIRTIASNPRVGLYFRQIGTRGLVGGIWHNGSDNLYCGAHSRFCKWNNLQFIRRFHTYSFATMSSGGRITVDGFGFTNTLQAASSAVYTNSTASLTDVFTIGSESETYKIKSIRLYNRGLTVAEAIQNAAEDEARFSLKPAADANGNANAFDDAEFYFRAAKQNTSAALDNTEFANALYIGSSSSPAGDSFTIGGSRNNVVVETMDVPAPYAGKTLKNRSVIHFKQPLNEDTTKASTSAINLQQPVAATNKASYTVMVRFKLDSRVNPNPEGTGQITLLELGYGYSGRSGVSLQFYGPADNLWVRAHHGGDADDFKDMQTDATKTLKAGEWVDMALVVNGRNNYLYYKTESGELYTGTRDKDTGFTSGTYGLYKLAIGGPADMTGIGTAATSSSTSAFRGWYQQVAVWDRALSRDEVLNAFCDGCADGDDWKVGVANDMSLEFAGRGAANVGTVNDWRNMTNELTSANSAVTVNFDLDAATSAKMRTFKLKTTSLSASGAFGLSVNGRTVAENVASAAGQSAAVTIPGGFFASGANTLTVTRSDANAGKMEIDCLSLVVAEGDVSAASGVAGDPFAGAYRWYRDDGSVFRDVLCTAYPNSSAHKWDNEQGPADNVVHTITDVVCPYSGATLADEKCLYFKQVSQTNANGVIQGKGGFARTSIFPVTNSVNYTAFVRFKIDSFQNPTNCVAEVFNVDYDWTIGRGISVRLTGSDPDNLSITLDGHKGRYSLTGTQSGETKNRLAKGKWIDMAVVVSNNWGYVYTCVEGGDFTYLGRNNFGNCGGTSTGRFDLGADRNASATFSSTWTTFFRGWVHQAAIWQYALSADDVKAVFGFPRPDVMRIGVENGSTAEFRGSAASSYTYPANADFRDAPDVVAAGGSLTVTFDLDASEVIKNQLLRIASTGESPDVALAVYVNGERIVNYTEAYAPVNEFAVDSGNFVEVGVKSRFLRHGSNTVTLTRLDSESDAWEIDSISLGNRGGHVRVRGSGIAVSFK